jgi:hypothetical protein
LKQLPGADPSSRISPCSPDYILAQETAFAPPASCSGLLQAFCAARCIGFLERSRLNRLDIDDSSEVSGTTTRPTRISSANIEQGSIPITYMDSLSNWMSENRNSKNSEPHRRLSVQQLQEANHIFPKGKLLTVHEVLFEIGYSKRHWPSLHRNHPTRDGRRHKSGMSLIPSSRKYGPYMLVRPTFQKSLAYRRPADAASKSWTIPIEEQNAVG